MKPMLSVEAQSQHLSKSIMLEETGSPVGLRLVVLFGSAVVTAFLIWASLMQLDEVATAPGEIVPNSNITKIQHLHGGIVSEISVEDGDHVEAGQVLLRLNPLPYRSQLEQAQTQMEILATQQVRLRALIDDTSPDFSRLQLQNREFIDDQRRIFTQQRNGLESGREILQNQIRQLQAESRELEQRKSSISQQINLMKQELAIRKDLVDKGLDSRVEYLGLQRQYNDLEGELRRIPMQVAGIDERIMETRNRIAAQVAATKKQYAEELARTDEQIVQWKDTIRGYLDDVEYLEITAPIDGYVHGLQTHSVGEIVGSGDTMMEIVPENSPLIAVVQISSQDIGHVRIGQTTTLKLTTYNYGRYGGLKGTLTEISPTTLLNRSGNPYYRGIVTFENAYIGSDPRKYPVLPGMTLQADITTGSKTVLEYLLKPIYASASTALRER